MFGNPYILLLIVVIVLVGWVRRIRYPSKRDRAWRDAAESLGLEYDPEGADGLPEIRGRMEGRPVRVQLKRSGDWLSKVRLGVVLRIYPRRFVETTVVAAHTGVEGLAEGTKVANRMLRDQLKLWANIGVTDSGNEVFDAHFWSNGHLNAKTRAHLTEPSVLGALRGMIKPLRRVVVEDGEVRIESSGGVTSEEQLGDRLRQVVTAAETIAEAGQNVHAA